jgi:ADP-ribose pyrophosphatase
MSNAPTEEHVTSARRIYEGKVINLRVDTVVLPQGKTSEREIVEHRGAVALVPITGDGQVMLVRQWRTPTQSALLEIPAGTREEGEDPDACAHRELGEEVNFAAGRMTKLCEMFMAPGYSTELIHLYLAQDLTPMQGTPDDDEFLDIITLPLSEAINKIAAGEIRDAKSISGLLLAARVLSSQPAHGTGRA